MDSTDEEFYGSTSFTITKGIRTKRQRNTTTTTTTAATSSYGGSYGSSASPSTPADDLDDDEVTTEEEVDMANCLILLARGSENKTQLSSDTNTNTNTNDNKSRFGVYECKTCNRAFSSFQALGGHRTSHKKVVRQASPNTLITKPDDCIIIIQSSGTTTTNTTHDPSTPPEPARIRARVHECSICGSEFPSGQALGGHMRRHRPVVTPDHRQMISDSTTTVVIDSNGPNDNNILSLDLDLNLPAPDYEHDDQIMVDKFHILPTPPLLDCHY